MDDTLGQTVQDAFCPQRRPRAVLLMLLCAATVAGCSQPTPVAPAERGHRIWPPFLQPHRSERSAGARWQRGYWVVRQYRSVRHLDNSILGV